MLKDSDIREPLFDYLEETFGKVRILEEKVTGRSRADVVMITEDAVTGLEIKSDADSYTRLAGQVRDYSRCYDFNYAVVGSRHAMHILEHLPEWWGAITVDEEDGRPDFYLLRRARRNPEPVLEQKLRLLWKDELAEILLSNRLPAYTSKNKNYQRAVLLDRVPESRLNRDISERLFERDYTVFSVKPDPLSLALRPKKRRRKRRL